MISNGGNNYENLSSIEKFFRKTTVLSIWNIENETYSADEMKEVLSNEQVEKLTRKWSNYQVLLGNLYDKEVKKRHDIFIRRKNEIDKKVKSQVKHIEELRDAELERLVLKHNLKTVVLRNDYLKRTNNLLRFFIDSEPFNAEKHEEMQFKIDKEYIENFTKINNEHQKEIAENTDKWNKKFPDFIEQFELEDAEQKQHDRDILKIAEKFKEREEQAIQNCVRDIQEYSFKCLEKVIIKKRGDINRYRKEKRETISKIIKNEIPRFFSLLSTIPNPKFVNKVYTKLVTYVSTQDYLKDDTEEKRSNSIKYWLMGEIQIAIDPDSISLHHVDSFICKEKYTKKIDIYICQECKKAIHLIPQHQKMDIWFLRKDDHNFLNPDSYQK